jgi:hypothetical protein
MENIEYKANLTGAWFLFYEMKQVVKLIVEGLNDKDIRNRVYEENLFQHKRMTSIKRSFPTVLRRAHLLSAEHMEILLEGSMENAKLVNLLAIYLEDKLFNEFLLEVLRDKYMNNEMTLEKMDVNIYFTHKSEQNDKVASFTDSTRNKLRQVYFKILVEAGILSDIKTGELNRIFFDDVLRSALISSGNMEFIKIFE